MRSEDLGAVLSVSKPHERIPRIPAKLRQPSHRLRRVIVVLIIGGGRGKNRQPRVAHEEVASLGSNRSREEHHGAHLRMTSCHAGGLCDAAAPTRHADARWIDTGLAQKRSECVVDIGWPRVAHQLNRFGAVQ